jgi:hypothetical protein
MDRRIVPMEIPYLTADRYNQQNKSEFIERRLDGRDHTSVKEMNA